MLLALYPDQGWDSFPGLVACRRIIHVPQKEKNVMTTAPPDEETLPEGMAVVETADRRWFPALAPSPSSERPRWVSLIDEPGIVPLALNALSDSTEGYEERNEAVAACWAWHEATVLSADWQVLAMSTEVYPERNSWYLEEIARLIGSDTQTRVFATYGFATVMAGPYGVDEVIMARGMTRDETIANLYQRVYEWSCIKRTGRQRAS
jgi:hypothetical protein